VGAWGAGSFDNDAAGDWTDEFKKSKNLGPVIEAFARILEAEDFIYATTASEALAACEVLARLKGNSGAQTPYSKPVDDWVLQHPQAVPKDLVDEADQAINRILSRKSELAELWGKSKEWRDAVEDLRRRLQA
jgi:hypothetical protein